MATDSLEVKPPENTRFKFTKTALAAVACPEGKAKYRVHDTESSGLSMLVTANGARAFYYYKWANGRPIEEKLGTVDELTPDQARTIVDKKNAQLRANIDPRAEKKAAREASTLGDMWTTYRTDVKKAERTLAEDLGLWNRYLAKWEGKRLADVTEEAVQKLYNRIAAGEFDGESTDKFGRVRKVKGGPSAARHTVKLLREMFSACNKTFRLQGRNPATDIRREKEESCTRYLTAEEFPAFWTALQEQSELIRDVIKMALFTAQRRAVLLSMEWAEVNLDFATWTIRADKMKSRKAHVVPLVPQAIEILKRRKEAAEEGAVWVFDSKGASGRINNPEKALARINAVAKLTPPISLHDLRRTTATWANSTGASEATIAGFLAHKHRSVTGIYAKATADTMRVALKNAVDSMMAATAPVKKRKAAG
jgi:integrase